MMDRDEQICNCMGVTCGEIVDAVKDGNLTTADEVGEVTSAGTACGACVDTIQEIIDEINS